MLVYRSLLFMVIFHKVKQYDNMLESVLDLFEGALLLNSKYSLGICHCWAHQCSLASKQCIVSNSWFWHTQCFGMYHQFFSDFPSSWWPTLLPLALSGSSCWETTATQWNPNAISLPRFNFGPFVSFLADEIMMTRHTAANAPFLHSADRHTPYTCRAYDIDFTSFKWGGGDLSLICSAEHDLGAHPLRIISVQWLPH